MISFKPVAGVSSKRGAAPSSLLAWCCVLNLLTAAVLAQTPAGFESDPARSRLEFSGTQAGATFKALVKSFNAKVQLDPDRLGDGRIEVDMDLRSVDSQDSERDNTMRGGDFFDVTRFPRAHYVSRHIEKTSTGYSAIGSLTLRGVTRDVPIQFTFAASGTAANDAGSESRSGSSGATLSGTALVKRLDFGVGQGEWKSTAWVGNDVRITFKLSLTPAQR